MLTKSRFLRNFEENIMKKKNLRNGKTFWNIVNDNDELSEISISAFQNKQNANGHRIRARLHFLDVPAKVRVMCGSGIGTEGQRQQCGTRRFVLIAANAETSSQCD